MNVCVNVPSDNPIHGCRRECVHVDACKHGVYMVTRQGESYGVGVVEPTARHPYVPNGRLIGCDKSVGLHASIGTNVAFSSVFVTGVVKLVPSILFGLKLDIHLYCVQPCPQDKTCTKKDYH